MVGSGCVGTALGFFKAIAEREKRRVLARGGAGDRGGCGGGGGGPGGGRGFFLNANDALVGNLPAEMFLLAARFKTLFKENGAAGIRREGAGSGQNDIAGAILYLDLASEKVGVASHIKVRVCGVPEWVNGTEGLPRDRTVGKSKKG